MNLSITYPEFVQVCPSAEVPDELLFDRLKSEIESKTNFVEEILGKTLAHDIESAKADLVLPSEDSVTELAKTAKRYVCTAAFRDALPHLDLVLTPNGFGVVSNQNVAPASADRVERLREALRRASLAHFDHMLDYARHFESFLGTWGCRSYFHSLFWRGDHCRHLGIPNPTRDDLEEKRPALNAKEDVMREILSPEFYAELIKAESTATANYEQEETIGYIRRAIGVAVVEPKKYPAMLRILLSWLESQKEAFPTYVNSQAYKARHSEPYENEQDDPCYFFGGI